MPWLVRCVASTHHGAPHSCHQCEWMHRRPDIVTRLHVCIRRACARVYGFAHGCSRAFAVSTPERARASHIGTVADSHSTHARLVLRTKSQAPAHCGVQTETEWSSSVHACWHRHTGGSCTLAVAGRSRLHRHQVLSRFIGLVCKPRCPTPCLPHPHLPPTPPASSSALRRVA